MKTTGPKYAQKEFRKRLEHDYVIRLEHPSPFKARIKQETTVLKPQQIVLEHLQYGRSTHELQPEMKGFETDCLPATKNNIIRIY